MCIIIDGFDQGTDQWFKSRTGSIGASSISKIITSTGKVSTQRKAYLYQLAGEKLTGVKAESYSSQAMEEGIRRESESREVFEFAQNVKVDEVAMILPFDGAGYHCSPDGIIHGKDEGLELKNVLAATQCQYLDKNTLPSAYRLQCQFSLFVTGWDLWHFFSYHPGIKPLHIRVKRDEKLIAVILSEMARFIEDLDALVERLRA